MKCGRGVFGLLASLSLSTLSDIGQLRLEIEALEEISRQLFLEVYSLKNMQERQRWSRTVEGRFFNVMGHFFSIYCLWKIFIVSTPV